MYLTLLLLTSCRVRTSSADASFNNPMKSNLDRAASDDPNAIDDFDVMGKNDKPSCWLNLPPGTQVARIASSDMGDVWCAMVQEPIVTDEDTGEDIVPEPFGVVFRKQSWERLVENSTQSFQSSWEASDPDQEDEQDDGSVDENQLTAAEYTALKQIEDEQVAALIKAEEEEEAVQAQLEKAKLEVEEAAKVAEASEQTAVVEADKVAA